MKPDVSYLHFPEKMIWLFELVPDLVQLEIILTATKPILEIEILIV